MILQNHMYYLKNFLINSDIPVCPTIGTYQDINGKVVHNKQQGSYYI